MAFFIFPCVVDFRFERCNSCSRYCELSKLRYLEPSQKDEFIRDLKRSKTTGLARETAQQKGCVVMVSVLFCCGLIWLHFCFERRNFRSRYSDLSRLCPLEPSWKEESIRDLKRSKTTSLAQDTAKKKDALWWVVFFFCWLRWWNFCFERCNSRSWYRELIKLHPL